MNRHFPVIKRGDSPLLKGVWASRPDEQVQNSIIQAATTAPTPTRKSRPKHSEKRDTPWKIVVLDDPVNLMGYVTLMFMKIFSYPRERAERHMMEVHEKGRSIVWTGKKEPAEMFVQQLHQAQLKAVLEKDEA